MRINFTSGFSLVELLVAISIVTVIMGTVVFNYSKSNDAFVAGSATQELAIAIRQTQVYGVSVKETGTGTGAFSSAYGIYFNPSASQTDYYIFVDKNGNGLYDAGTGCGTGSTECVQKTTLRNGMKIQDVCVVPNSASDCSSTVAGSMYVTFLRPNPDAHINFYNSSNTLILGSQANGRVRLVSPQGKVVGVTVQSSGEVLAQ